MNMLNSNDNQKEILVEETLNHIKENEAYPSLITSAEIDEDKCLFCKKC